MTATTRSVARKAATSFLPRTSVVLGGIIIFTMGYIAGYSHRSVEMGNSFYYPHQESSFVSDTTSSATPLTTATNTPDEITDTAVVAPLASNTTTTNTIGWKTIHVFYGQKIVKGIPMNTSQTQANQDKIVAGLLRGKQGGYFVDLAANDAIDMSNTYALERQYGWKGLCIEANPKYWRNLVFYRDCDVVGAVIGQNRMEEVTFELELWGGVGGGIVGTNYDNKQKTKGAKTLYTVPLEDILQSHATPVEIDYLSLDVEGAEDYIMKAFPFDSYRIKVMTVERPKNNFFTILESQGYICVGKISNFGETLWVHKDVQEELDMDSITKNTNYHMKKCRYP